LRDAREGIARARCRGLLRAQGRREIRRGSGACALFGRVPSGARRGSAEEMLGVVMLVAAQERMRVHVVHAEHRRCCAWGVLCTGDCRDWGNSERHVPARLISMRVADREDDCSRAGRCITRFDGCKRGGGKLHGVMVPWGSDGHPEQPTRRERRCSRLRAEG
jgi:hypothetical protein